MNDLRFIVTVSLRTEVAYIHELCATIIFKLNLILQEGVLLHWQKWTQSESRNTTLVLSKYSVKMWNSMKYNLLLRWNANTLHFLCCQKKFFPAFDSQVITAVQNFYCADCPFLMHQLVVIYSGIPTFQDYLTWVSIIHCAWHPLSHHYLSVLATYFSGYLFFWKRGILSCCACKIIVNFEVITTYCSCLWSVVFRHLATSSCIE